MGQYVMGVYGINIDLEMGQENFEYLIADPYNPQKDVPEGLVTRTIPAFDWAVFPCKGAMPNALQDVNTKIYTEWLPALKEYEFAAGYCVEYYDDPTKYEKGTQDEKKQYAAQLSACGIPKSRIRKYGFAFQGKKVLIG